MRMRIMIVLDATACGEGIGPRSPVGDIRTGPGGTYHKQDGPFGNRGPGGPPAYYLRAEDGSGRWVDGRPAAPCGSWVDA